jgi:hypothetical protein
MAEFWCMFQRSWKSTRVINLGRSPGLVGEEESTQVEDAISHFLHHALNVTASAATVKNHASAHGGNSEQQDRALLMH